MSGDGEWRCARGMDESRCRYYHDDDPDFAQCGPAPSPSIPDPSDERGLHSMLVAATRTRMAHAGWSQADLAAATGYTEKHVSRVLAGHNDGTFEFWDAIASHLGPLAAGAARPTSLPEAPEPDGQREVRVGDLGTLRGNSDGSWSAHRRGWTIGVADTWAEALDLLTSYRDPRAATPSAPPVAVDPEAGAGAS